MKVYIRDKTVLKTVKKGWNVKIETAHCVFRPHINGSSEVSVRVLSVAHATEATEGNLQVLEDSVTGVSGGLGLF